jgi:acetolactate synthase I/II/III large subunit
LDSGPDYERHQKTMNGAESLIRSLVVGGIDTCFANPGTSEMHLVAAMDRVPEMRCILALFEGVVTGAADGYARIAEKPACTLLHLGPGLANGLANLHNARRANVPIVNLIGQHPASHLVHDTPLASDIEAIARPYSKWLRTSHDSTQAGKDAADAIVAARTAPGQIATLIVPADAAWSDGGVAHAALSIRAAKPASDTAIDRAAAMLSSGAQTAFLLSGNTLYGAGLVEAGRIATATGAKLFCPYPFTRLERGAGVPVVERMAYILEQAQEQLKPFRNLILVGAPPPVAYFAYPDKSSVLTSPETDIHFLARAEEDLVGSLRALADVVAAGEISTSHDDKVVRPNLPSGEITLTGISSAVGALLPKNAILVDESMTSGRGLMPATSRISRHDWLGNTGGSIGIAMPLAVGAAVAAPHRPVLCLTADGSGMYTLQALWTMARESLRITTVVFANRTYGVLKREFSYLGVGEPGPKAGSLFDIGHPDIDWVHLAKGMGVPATRATSLEDFGKALSAGFESGGPTLIEVPV